MGNTGWDDDTWRRGRSPRDGRSPDVERSHSHAARGSARGWDDNGARGRGHDRAGSSGRGGRGDDGRSGSESRRGGYERSSSRSRPMSRDEYENGRPRERAMRGPRPPGASRDDGYGQPRHHHRPDGMPGASSGRNRPPDRGGLWGDDGARARRAGAAGPPGMRGAVRPDPRDPRLAARRPMGGAAVEDDEDEESSFSLGKAMLVILMMFALGAVAGFGYFRLSAPTVHTGGNNNNNQQQQRTPSPSTTPSASPSTTPAATTTTTPQADIRPAGASGPMARMSASGGASAAQAYVIVVRPQL